MPSNRTPTATNTSPYGTAAPLPAGMDIDAYVNMRWQQYHIAPPAGYHVDEDTNTVVRDEPTFLLRHPWLFPLMGVGAGAGLAAAGVGGGATGAAGAAGATGGTGAASAGTAAATGGTLGALRGILGLAGQVAPILNGISQGRDAARQNTAQNNQAQARAAADIFRTRMDASLKGPRQSASDAAYGDTLANIQPFSWTGANKMVGNIPVPQSSGGMGPQNFGPATRTAGQNLATLGASRVTSPSFNLPEPPVLPDLPQAGTADSILNGAGTVASILAAYGLYNQGRNGTGQPMPRTQYDPNDTNGYG